MLKISQININNLGEVKSEISCEDIFELATAVTTFSWSPSLFTERKRTNKNMLKTELFVLDIDSGLSLADAIVLFKDHKHIIGTTKNHQVSKRGLPATDRFRVILFLDKPIQTDDDFKTLWLSLQKQWPFMDPACKDVARFFYPCKEIKSICEEGQMVRATAEAKELTNGDSFEQQLFGGAVAHDCADGLPLAESKEGEGINTPQADNTDGLLKASDEASKHGLLSRSTIDFLLKGAPDGSWHGAMFKACVDIREQGYTEEEAIELCTKITGHLDKHDTSLIRDVYNNRDVKYEKRMQKESFDKFLRELLNKEGGGATAIRANRMTEAAFTFLKDKDRVVGEITGMSGLDKMLGGGWRRGEVTVLMAQAKTGKNTLYHYLMYHSLQRNIPQGYASRELDPAADVIPNLLAIHFRRDIWRNELTEKEKKEATELIESWPLWFAPGYGTFPIEDLVTWYKVLQEQAGVQYFWLDHFHYMLEKEEYEATTVLARLIKGVTKAFNVHTNLIVQPGIIKQDQKLSLNTLRGAAAIGQALDNLLILERIPTTDGTQVSKLKLEVARAKIAKPGEIYLRYESDSCIFTEVQKEKVQTHDAPGGAACGGEYKSSERQQDWDRERSSFNNKIIRN